MRLNLALFFSAIIMFTASSQAAVTQVSASVDKNPVMVDESLILTITANGDVAGDAFDSSALLQDFIVGRTSVSRQTQMVNFNTSRNTTWTTVLIAKQEGRFTIPSFTIAGQTTQPIALRVVPVSTSSANRGRDIYITTAVDNHQVYLQQQLRYTIKLHLAMDLQRGSLQAPVLENADIRQLGKDTEYSDIINGKRYRIIERNFAIIPQQSGQYTINGPLFEGEVLTNGSQGFGFFNRTRNINRVGPAIQIDVLPIPTHISGHWLPSEYVQLSEEWQQTEQGYQVGEPITRTLTLSAIGLVEEQLPTVTSDYPPSIKTYPDQASTTTVEKDNMLIAQRVENIALIPSRAGTFVIPSISIPWFNTKTGKTEYATLPARSIEVTAASTAAQSRLPAIPQATPQPQAETPTTAIKTVAPATSPAWWSVSSWVLLTLWLVTLLLYWKSKYRHKESPSPQTNHPVAIDKAWQQLKHAIKQGQPAGVVQPLTCWLGYYCHNPHQPLPVSQRQLNNNALNQAIDALFACQFSASPQAWQSDNLTAALQQLKQNSKSKALDKKGLQPLYPQTR